MSKLFIAVVVTAAIIIGGLMLTACGGSDGAASEALKAPTVYDEQDIRNAVGDQDGDGFVKMDGQRCEIITVLTKPSTVEFYADMGNIVATNPDQTVGIDVASYGAAATCHRLFTERLADFG